MLCFTPIATLPTGGLDDRACAKTIDVNAVVREHEYSNSTRFRKKLRSGVNVFCHAGDWMVLPLAQNTSISREKEADMLVLKIHDHLVLALPALHPRYGADTDNLMISR